MDLRKQWVFLKTSAEWQGPFDVKPGGYKTSDVVRIRIEGEPYATAVIVRSRVFDPKSAPRGQVDRPTRWYMVALMTGDFRKYARHASIHELWVTESEVDRKIGTLQAFA